MVINQCNLLDLFNEAIMVHLQEATTCDVASTIDNFKKQHNISVPFFLQQQLLIYNVNARYTSVEKKFSDYRHIQDKATAKLLLKAWVMLPSGAWGPSGP